jgi:hypothetical protein
MDGWDLTWDFSSRILMPVVTRRISGGPLSSSGTGYGPVGWFGGLPNTSGYRSPVHSTCPPPFLRQRGRIPRSDRDLNYRDPLSEFRSSVVSGGPRWMPIPAGRPRRRQHCQPPTRIRDQPHSDRGQSGRCGRCHHRSRTSMRSMSWSDWGPLFRSWSSRRLAWVAR